MLRKRPFASRHFGIHAQAKMLMVFGSFDILLWVACRVRLSSAYPQSSALFLWLHWDCALLELEPKAMCKISYILL